MKKNILSGIGLLSVSFLLQAQEENSVEYNPAFFSGTNIDITALSIDNQLEPGGYDVELYINGKIIGTTSITLVRDDKKNTLIYFKKSVLPQLGFKDEVNQFYLKNVDNNHQVSLENNNFDIKVNFNSATLSVNIIAPQVTLNYTPRGYVDPSAWDSGLTAAMINYTSNYYHSQTSIQKFNDSYDSFFSSVNTWINAGVWQFRNFATVTAGNQNKVNMLRTYLQRDIPKILSVVQTGEIDTRESFLPATPLLGISLFSDDRMLPDSKRGYVPDIRGMANTNAKVTIRQNGNVVYETTVSPGTFLISDLYQASHGGDFNVTVQETDGTQRTFIVPYASLPELLRPRQSKYSLAIGTLNDNSLRKKPAVSSMSYHRGLNNYLTGFGGVQFSEDYQSTLVGLAINTTVGAVSSSMAFSNANLGYKTSQGHNINLSYSNVVNSSGTSINVATYHYSSSGFSTLQDAARVKDDYDYNQQMSAYNLRSINQKNSVQLSINQPFSNSGSIYITAGFNNYWGYSGNSDTYQMGFSNQYKRLSYTLSASRTYDVNSSNNETQYQLSFSFPLGNTLYTPMMTTAYTQSSRGRGYASTSIYGTALENRSLSYGLSTNVYTSGEEDNYYSGNVSKVTPYGNRSASASSNKHTKQYSLGMNGSFALHSGGITFGQYTGDTVGLIEAPGAAGAIAASNHNIKIDSRGYAIFPYLSPYRNNEVSLNPNTGPSDLEIINTSVHTAPYAGAIVKLKFDTLSEALRVFEVKHQGQNVPLGATANHNGKMIGMVGGSGMLTIRENKKSRINVTWSDENNLEKTCSFDIEENTQTNSTNITKKLVNCT